MVLFVFSDGWGGDPFCLRTDIHPPPGSVPGNANRATLCPMGSRCPGLNAVIRMPSAMVKGKAPLLFVILHKYCCFVQCLNRVHPKKTRFNTISCVLMHFYGIYRTFLLVFTAPGASDLVAACILHTFLRSAPGSAAVCLAAVWCVLVQFLPYHRLLLRQILSLHWCRAGYSVC